MVSIQDNNRRRKREEGRVRNPYHDAETQMGAYKSSSHREEQHQFIRRTTKPQAVDGSIERPVCPPLVLAPFGEVRLPRPNPVVANVVTREHDGLMSAFHFVQWVPKIDATFEELNEIRQHGLLRAPLAQTLILAGVVLDLWEEHHLAYVHARNDDPHREEASKSRFVLAQGLDGLLGGQHLCPVFRRVWVVPEVFIEDDELECHELERAGWVAVHTESGSRVERELKHPARSLSPADPARLHDECSGKSGDRVRVCFHEV